uniref:Polyketide synthase AS3D902 n=1 Tax=Azadinium spinosum TaxID=632150 RepID=A0A0A0VE51_9DINO|nr:polyketide synthase AS3D902 [Azadinium spinosum]
MADKLMDYNPVLGGLHLGQLVQIFDSDTEFNGFLGQLADYNPETSKYLVAIIKTGDMISVDAEYVRTVLDCKGPGAGGNESSFDIVIGPRTSHDALGEMFGDSLSTKGFCVVKIIQGQEDLAKSFDTLKSLESDGKLGRLAQEVEEGYLGKNGRAKVMWLDPDDDAVPQDDLVKRNDANITTMAEILQPHMEDILGFPIAERSPALACVSMNDKDEADFESPFATDKQLQEYYATWTKSVLRLVHYMGPSGGKVTLTKKAACPLNNLEDSYEIEAVANTILLVREDCFDFAYEEPDEGEACWLMSFMLKPGAVWDLEGDLVGDTDVFGTVGDGPGPPTDPKLIVSVCAISLQACGRMTDHHKEWAAYTSGCDGQLEMPFLRFDYAPYYSDEVDNPQGTTFVKHFSVQDGIELFDNRIFEISNMESTAMDPMCRQVMEVGYLSIFKIGITKKYCNTNAIHASVSVGCDKQEWLNLPEAPRSVATNNQLAIMANRFNYVFNLKGGSYVCDTACSSSLIASHLGKVNLLETRWDPLAWHLGLGAGLTLTVGSFIGSCSSHMLSPGGRCFTFNATANGYNRGDGTACMLIKAGPCEGDRIAYFRGSQIGQDGRSASMSAPNGPAQEKCVWGAIREAQMTPPESTVWECHGTGTSLGDPIEVGAVRKVQIKMKRLEPLMIASSKSNFGHLEGSAAAIAMNKCVCVVCQIVCAPTQHLKCLNPHLDHAAFEAIFIAEHLPYKYIRGHCQVSSFGVGGTNGHAIFWGEGYRPPPDFKKLFVKKITDSAPPIIADGSDPSSWEYSGLPLGAEDQDKQITIRFEKDPITEEEVISYEVQEEEILEPPEFYCTTGSHNEWAEDRMMEGDVPSLFYQETEMPENGTLEFRILAEGDQDKVFGPSETTSKMIAPIEGPDKDIRTSWVINGPPGNPVRLEFFAPPKGAKSVCWILVKEE